MPNFPTVDESHRLWPLFCPRPTVRIAFYTDDDAVLDPNQDFGATHLRDLIHSANTFYADFQIDIVNRFEGAGFVNGVLRATQTLTPAFLAQYDQVWFFGVNQCNLPFAPDNELSDAEVDALRDWMTTGGVLMTGDHANPNPAAGNGLDPLLNLGRALGHRVPRAGELRKWEGLPSSSTGFTSVGDPMGPRENHNTQQPDGVTNIDNLALQTDGMPQPLLLTKYPLWSWHPWFVRETRPHPLFCGRSGPITVFPDHMHEGMIVIPPAGGADWPAGGVGPEVVASGRDTRTNRVWPVVAAYDGQPGGVGRIVADSTWHHYFNVNLRGFAPGSSALTAISDYYVNLAVWLSPPAKRAAMRCSVLWWLVRQDAVREVSLQPIWIVGETAFDVLGRSAGRCTLIDLVIPWRDYVLVEPKFPPRPWPPEEWIIGGILQEYQRASVLDDKIGDRLELQRRGLENAVRAHAEAFEGAAKQAIGFVEDLGNVLEPRQG